MPAYVIANYDVVNQEDYYTYLPAVSELLNKHGGEVLVADFGAKQLEGEKRGVNVVLKFDSEEAALGWYNDSAYEPVRKIRLEATTNGYMALAKQFVQPGN